MKRYAPFVLLAFAGILAQMTLLAGLPRPDLAFLVVVYLGLNRPFGQSIPAVLIIGYLTDTFSGLPDGTFLLAYLLLFCAAYACTKVLYFRGRMFPVVVSTILSVAYLGLLALLFALGYRRPLAESAIDLGTSVGFVIVNCVSAIILFRVCHWIDARMGSGARPSRKLTHVLPGE